MTCSGLNCSIPHGEHGRYSHGCRCGDCRSAHASYEAMRVNHRTLAAGHGYVDAAPFVAILGSLYRSGYGLGALAELCGVNRVTIERVVFGETVNVQRATAAKLRTALELLPSETP